MDYPAVNSVQTSHVTMLFCIPLRLEVLKLVNWELDDDRFLRSINQGLHHRSENPLKVLINPTLIRNKTFFYNELRLLFTSGVESVVPDDATCWND